VSLRVSGLRKTFGDVVAVDDVSFVAQDGRTTGILGPNGAGKTTSLRMLYGLLRPDRGSVDIDGIDPYIEPRRARARLGVLADSKGIYPRLTARENIAYFGRIHGLRGSELDDRVAELIRELDLSGVADRRAEGYSQGERMKVAIGRALVHGPANVILDEPTNGLDVLATRAMRDLITRLRDRGRCVLFSSHVMQEVSALCDHIVVIAKGRVAAEGSPDELRAQTGHDSLEDTFVALIGEQGLGS
jgi:sodium transport system ATP-binding protein